MLPVLLLAAFASAAEFKPAGKGAVTGVVELTLYAGIDRADPFWYVEGRINDKPVLLRIATEVEGLVLTEAAAGRVGLKVTGKDDEKKSAVPELNLGEAKITGLKANIAPIKEFSYATDGALGIASISELAWAIEPAAGKVKVGASGAQSVATAIGTETTFGQKPKNKEKVGTEKQEIGARVMGTNASFSGVALDTTFATGRGATRVATEVDGGAEWFRLDGVENPKFPLPAVAGTMRGETELEWREVTVAGVPVWTTVERQGAGLLYPLLSPSRIGQDVLAHLALGVDAARKVYAVKASSGTAAVPYADTLEARYRADVDAAAADPGEDADAARAALAGKLSPLVGLLNKTEQFGEAVEAGKRWTEADPQHCTSWLALGQAQLGAGDAAAAIVSYQKAGDLYQPWSVRPLAERTALAASEGKRSKSPDFDGVWAQPNSCYVAWGELGVAMIAAGRAEAVAGLYPKYADLDDYLPLAAGNALLVQGNAAAAEAA